MNTILVWDATLHNSYLLKLNNMINICVFLITDFACIMSNFLSKCTVPRLLVFFFVLLYLFKNQEWVFKTV